MRSRPPPGADRGGGHGSLRRDASVTRTARRETAGVLAVIQQAAHGLPPTAKIPLVESWTRHTTGPPPRENGSAALLAAFYW